MLNYVQWTHGHDVLVSVQVYSSILLHVASVRASRRRHQLAGAQREVVGFHRVRLLTESFMRSRRISSVDDFVQRTQIDSTITALEKKGKNATESIAPIESMQNWNRECADDEANVHSKKM